ncbi:MAG: lysostaphin resistance A-like protein [Jatrophihabitantaceae bacterium]
MSAPPPGPYYRPPYYDPYYRPPPLPGGIPPAEFDPRPRLDRLMALMRVHDGGPWGWRPAVLPCLVLAALIVVGDLTTHAIHPRTFGAALAVTIGLEVILYGTLGTAIWFAGRDLARRYAGWGWAFGLQRPKWMDGAWLAAGVGLALIGRIVVVLVANALTHNTAAEQSQNLAVKSHSTAVYVLLAVVVVLVAPFVEELVFRGLMLRTFMRRWGFWPAALLSSAIFAVFHTYQVNTLAGAVTLACVVFTLGMTNCLLVRWSGRLAAGIGVHALFNGLAVLVLVLTN